MVKTLFVMRILHFNNPKTVASSRSSRPLIGELFNYVQLNSITIKDYDLWAMSFCAGSFDNKS